MLKSRLGYVMVVIVVAGATVLSLLLLQNIFTRKREAEQVVFKLVDIDETTIDPALWGKNFPRQYDGYTRTVDMVRTRFGGSEADPHETTQAYSKIEGPAPEDHVGRIRLRHRLPRGARPRLHAQRSARHASASSRSPSPAHACTATRR